MFDALYDKPLPDFDQLSIPYSDAELDAMHSAHMDAEEHAETHCQCGGELVATEAGLVVCAICRTVVKTFARETWEDAA